ncbi:MAG: single-stranded DNA-binding protein [Tepidisphaeraceae bacterium]|jgi:single-strand DNA-binding protein
MANVNKVILIGNLTRDPQLKYLPSQTAVAEFGLAMNRKFKLASGEDREEVCFVDCSAFGRTGEVINQYCRKGKQIYIEGRLKLDQWEDKQGGGKRSRLTVVVENFQFLGGRDGAPASGGDSAPGEEDQRPPAKQPQARAPQGGKSPAPQEPPIGEEQHFGESDIPF